MPFQDRGHAAHLLAKWLAGYRGQRPLVLGIPRGAVPMAKLIAAMAVVPATAVKQMEVETDEVVCLKVPAFFHAVGQFFEDVSQVSDAEVVSILRQSGPMPAPQT